MITKAAGAELDWPFSWTLEAGETIASSVWSITPAGVSGAAPAGTLAVQSGSPKVTGLVTACILTGGIFGRVYEVTNTITTSAGRKQPQTITIRIGPVAAT